MNRRKWNRIKALPASNPNYLHISAQVYLCPFRKIMVAARGVTYDVGRRAEKNKRAANKAARRANLRAAKRAA